MYIVSFNMHISLKTGNSLVDYKTQYLAKYIMHYTIKTLLFAKFSHNFFKLLRD